MKRAAALLVVAAACIPAEGPMMAPFQDCLGCHSSSGDARSWTAAGTWSKGSNVTLVDANGRTISLTGNQAGNFYTAEALAFPLTVYVDGAVMPDPNTGKPATLTYGGCNICHTHAGDPTAGALMAPGRPCLECHRAGGVAASRPFSAAGTFQPNATVSIGGHAFTTNAAGNFYFDAASQPIAFPTTARVGGGSMNAPHGDCNVCHGRGGGADGVGGD